MEKQRKQHSVLHDTFFLESFQFEEISSDEALQDVCVGVVRHDDVERSADLVSSAL